MRPVFDPPVALLPVSPTLTPALDDVRVLQDDVGDLQLVLHHVLEADALRAFGVDVEAALVLARQEALRHRR